MSDDSNDWAVKAANLSFSYGSGLLGGRGNAPPVLDDVSFCIRKGENFGVIGKNGCGKTSLLKILAGIISPLEGQLDFSGIQSKALLTLGLGFNTNLNGRDNALLSLMLQGINRKQATTLLDSIQSYAELGDHFDQPIRTYSAGMRARLGFAVGIMAETDLLLIDETLSVGDQQFRKKAHKTMLEKLSGSQTIVFISHDAQQVNNICTTGIWLDQGRVAAAGEIAEVTRAYADQIKNTD